MTPDKTDAEIVAEIEKVNDDEFGGVFLDNAEYDDLLRIAKEGIAYREVVEGWMLSHSVDAIAASCAIEEIDRLVKEATE